MTPHGTRAVIIGNGGSCDMMPPEFWDQDALYIGTNRALCIKALQGVQLDAVFMRDCWSSLWGDMKVSRRYNWGVWQKSNAYKVGPAEQRHTQCDEFVRWADGWQYEEVRDHNNEAAVTKNPSVVIMAANVAWFWGVREFQLMGVDYSGGMAEMEDGFNVSTGYDARYDKPVPCGVETAYRKMREAIEAGGGSIVNHSPGSKLEAVEKREWLA